MRSTHVEDRVGVPFGPPLLVILGVMSLGFTLMEGLSTKERGYLRKSRQFSCGWILTNWRTFPTLNFLALEAYIQKTV